MESEAGGLKNRHHNMTRIKSSILKISARKRGVVVAVVETNADDFTLIQTKLTTCGSCSQRLR